VDVDAKLHVPGEFDVVSWEMPDFVGDFTQMDYGDPAASRLAELREEFAVDEIIAGCDDELEALLALKRWVRSRWDHGWCPAFDTVTDALDILREAQRGESFSCGFYATVLVACATILGWPSRKINVGLGDCSFPRDWRVGNVGHSVPEIWCNDLAKWVMLDPDINGHYLRDGVPLSALEIGQAWLDGDGDEVQLVLEEPRFVLPSERSLEVVRGRGDVPADFDQRQCQLMFDRFTRNDVLDYYARLTVNGREWLDPRCPPTFVRHFNPYGGNRWTSHLPDVYWSVNLTRIVAAGAWDESGARLAISLEHCMPWFDHFEARIDGGDWERCEQTFTWPMHDAINSLACRAVNVQGRPGPQARIDVAYSPARW